MLKESYTSFICPVKWRQGVWACDRLIMSLIACLSGLVYSFCAMLDLLISLCLLTARLCVSVCSCASQPTFLFFFLFFGGLHSLFFCHFQSCRAVSKDCLVLCVCVCVCARSVAPLKPGDSWDRGMASRARGRRERRREGDSCVLPGIPKMLYDLNDKRRLGHALCIKHCTCTVIPIKQSARFSSGREERAEKGLYRKWETCGARIENKGVKNWPDQSGNI